MPREQPDPQEQLDRQRRQQLDNANLQRQADNGSNVRVLEQLSNLSDLPTQPQDDETVGQFASRVVSTTNLSDDEVKSYEWMKEVVVLLYLATMPEKEGVHGVWRGWCEGDMSKEVEAISPQKRAELESFIRSTNLAVKRSRDAKVIEEGSRDVRESIVDDGEGEDGGSSGILGKI